MLLIYSKAVRWIINFTFSDPEIIVFVLWQRINKVLVKSTIDICKNSAVLRRWSLGTIRSGLRGRLVGCCVSISTSTTLTGFSTQNNGTLSRKPRQRSG